MQMISKYLDIPLSDIPMSNLRNQFFNNYHLFKDEAFQKKLMIWEPEEPIETNYISWYYWIDQFYTFMAQHIIVGVESYLPAAVYFELGKAGKLNKESLGFVRNPFSIKGKGGTAKKYYIYLPSLISEEISLDKNDNNLWKKVDLFYKELRNPIFHGKQFDTNDPKFIVGVFELVADIYAWIDGWHNPDEVIPGSSWFTKLERT